MGRCILGRKPTYMKSQADYKEFWAAKTSKRMQPREKKVKVKMDKRRCSTKIFVDLLDNLDDKQ